MSGWLDWYNLDCKCPECKDDNSIACCEDGNVKTGVISTFVLPNQKCKKCGHLFISKDLNLNEELIDNYEED